MLLQLTAAGAQGWERVGLIGYLVVSVVLLAVAFTAGERVFFGIVPGYRMREKTEECDALRAEVKVLWAEKVEDGKEQAELAKAYLRLRDQEKS